MEAAEPLNLQISSKGARDDLARFDAALDKAAGAWEKFDAAIASGATKVEASLKRSMGSLEKFAQISALISRVRVSGAAASGLTQFAAAMNAVARVKVIDEAKVRALQAFSKALSTMRIPVGASKLAEFGKAMAEFRPPSANAIARTQELFRLLASFQPPRASLTTTQLFRAIADLKVPTQVQVTRLEALFKVLSNARAIPNAGGIAASLNAVAAAAQHAGAAANAAPAAFRAMGNGAHQAQAQVTGLRGALMSLGGSGRMSIGYQIGTLFTSMFSAFTLGAAVRSTVDATNHLMSLQKSMFLVTGSVNATNQGVTSFNKTVFDLGLNLKDVQGPFSRFLISAHETGMSMKDSQKVFGQFALALRAVGATNEQQLGSFYAIQEMLAKGKVQAKEFTRQLAQYIPGLAAFGAQAYSMMDGRAHSISDLYKAMKGGNLESKPFVQNLGGILDQEFGPLKEMIKLRPDYAINQWHSAMELFFQGIGSSGAIREMTSQMNSFVGTLVQNGQLTEKARGLAESIGQGFAVMARVAGGAAKFTLDHLDLLIAGIKVFAGLKLTGFAMNFVATMGQGVQGMMGMLRGMGANTVATNTLTGATNSQSRSIAANTALLNANSQAHVRNAAAQAGQTAAAGGGSMLTGTQAAMAMRQKMTKPSLFSPKRLMGVMGSAEVAENEVEAVGSVPALAGGPAGEMAWHGIMKAVEGVTLAAGLLGTGMMLLPGLFHKSTDAAGQNADVLKRLADGHVTATDKMHGFLDLLGQDAKTAFTPFEALVNGLSDAMKGLANWTGQVGDKIGGVVATAADGAGKLADKATGGSGQGGLAGAAANFATGALDVVGGAVGVDNLGGMTRALFDQQRAKLDANAKAEAAARAKAAMAKLGKLTGAQTEAISGFMAGQSEVDQVQQNLAAESLRQQAEERGKDVNPADMASMTTGKMLHQVGTDIGLDPVVLKNLGNRESGLNPNAPHAHSQYQGMFQLGDDALASQIARHGQEYDDKYGTTLMATLKQLGVTINKNATLNIPDKPEIKALLNSLKYGPTSSAFFAGNYYQQGLQQLNKGMGRPASYGEGYLAYNMGGGMASRFLKGEQAAPNADGYALAKRLGFNPDGQAKDIFYQADGKTHRSAADVVAHEQAVMTSKSTLKEDMPLEQKDIDAAAAEFYNSIKGDVKNTPLARQAEEASFAATWGSLADKSSIGGTRMDEYKKAQDAGVTGLPDMKALLALRQQAHDEMEAKDAKESGPLAFEAQTAKTQLDIEAKRQQGLTAEAQLQEMINKEREQGVILSEQDKSNALAILKANEAQAQVQAAQNGLAQARQNAALKLYAARNPLDAMGAKVRELVNSNDHSNLSIDEKMDRARQSGALDTYQQTARTDYGADVEATATSMQAQNAEAQSMVGMTEGARANVEAMKTKLGELLHVDTANSSLAQLEQMAAKFSVESGHAADYYDKIAKSAKDAADATAQIKATQQTQGELNNLGVTQGLSQRQQKQYDSYIATVRGQLGDAANGVTDDTQLIGKAQQTQHLNTDGTASGQNVSEYARSIAAAKAQFEEPPALDKWADSLQPLSERLDNLKVSFAEGLSDTLSKFATGEGTKDDWKNLFKSLSQQFIKGQIESQLGEVEKFFRPKKTADQQGDLNAAGVTDATGSNGSPLGDLWHKGMQVLGLAGPDSHPTAAPGTQPHTLGGMIGNVVGQVAGPGKKSADAKGMTIENAQIVITNGMVSFSTGLGGAASGGSKSFGDTAAGMLGAGGGASASDTSTPVSSELSSAAGAPTAGASAAGGPSGRPTLASLAAGGNSMAKYVQSLFGAHASNPSGAGSTTASATASGAMSGGDSSSAGLPALNIPTPDDLSIPDAGDSSSAGLPALNLPTPDSLNIPSVGDGSSTPDLSSFGDLSGQPDVMAPITVTAAGAGTDLSNLNAAPNPITPYPSSSDLTGGGLDTSGGPITNDVGQMAQSVGAITDPDTTSPGIAGSLLNGAKSMIGNAGGPLVAAGLSLLSKALTPKVWNKYGQFSKINGVIGQAGSTEVKARHEAGHANPIATGINMLMNPSSIGKGVSGMMGGGGAGPISTSMPNGLSSAAPQLSSLTNPMDSMSNLTMPDLSSIVPMFHTGGDVTMAAPMSRYVAMSTFVNAPRYHDGTHNVGRDEVPAILHKDEAVVPLSGGRSIPVDLGDGASGTGIVNHNYNTNVTVNTPDAGSFRQSQGSIERAQALSQRKARARTFNGYS